MGEKDQDEWQFVEKEKVLTSRKNPEVVPPNPWIGTPAREKRLARVGKEVAGCAKGGRKSHLGERIKQKKGKEGKIGGLCSKGTMSFVMHGREEGPLAWKPRVPGEMTPRL